VGDRIKLASDGWLTEVITAGITTPPRQAQATRIDSQEAAPAGGAVR